MIRIREENLFSIVTKESHRVSGVIKNLIFVLLFFAVIRFSRKRKQLVLRSRPMAGARPWLQYRRDAFEPSQNPHDHKLDAPVARGCQQ